MKTNFGKYDRIIRFCIVGFSNFLIISLTVFVMGRFGFGYILQNVCAYTLAIASSFVWNKIWVFRSKGNNLKKEILLYLTAFGCAYLLQFSFVFVTVEFFSFNEYAAQFIGLFFFGATNYLMNKLLTFRER